MLKLQAESQEGRGSKGMGPCTASMPQILSQNLAAALTALGSTAHALSEKPSCTGSHRVDLLKITPKSMSSPTRAGSGSQGNASLPAEESQGQQQGPHGSKDGPPHTACPKHGSHHIKGLRAGSTWVGGGKRGGGDIPLLSLHQLYSNEHEHLGRSGPWPRCCRTQMGQPSCPVHLLSSGSTDMDVPFLPHMHKENIFHTCKMGRSRG